MRFVMTSPISLIFTFFPQNVVHCTNTLTASAISKLHHILVDDFIKCFLCDNFNHSVSEIYTTLKRAPYINKIMVHVIIF